MREINTTLLLRNGLRVLFVSAMCIICMWTLIQPSLAWTKVISRIKRPNVLQILTTQYFGNSDTSQGNKCFIDIMKFQRELLAIGLGVRGYMVQGGLWRLVL